MRRRRGRHRIADRRRRPVGAGEVPGGTDPNQGDGDDDDDDDGDDDHVT